MTVLLALGTRKGLWLARSDDRQRWSLSGRHFLAREIAAVGLDPRRDLVRITVGVHSEHWGRLRDETGALRRFVNVYVDGEDVRWDGGLAAAVPDGAVVQVLPSVAGG